MIHDAMTFLRNVFAARAAFLCIPALVRAGTTVGEAGAAETVACGGAGVALSATGAVGSAGCCVAGLVVWVREGAVGEVTFCGDGGEVGEAEKSDEEGLEILCWVECMHYCDIEWRNRPKGAIE